MFKAYLPNEEKTITVYIVEQYWQGEFGTWQHGKLESVPFMNKDDAQKFLDKIIEMKEWKNGTEDFGKNCGDDVPHISEYSILLQYVEPGNSRDFRPGTYNFHSCEEY
jgi:hypothetical protein